MNFPLVSRQALDEAELQLQALNQVYQNYRRRTSDDLETDYQSGRADAALQCLQVYDNLQRALSLPCEDEAFVTGIRMTLKSLVNILSTLGITEIPDLGETFDPALHVALEHITDPQVGENIITSVALAGFRQGDIILRHSLVVVAN